MIRIVKGGLIPLFAFSCLVFSEMLFCEEYEYHSFCKTALSKSAVINNYDLDIQILGIEKDKLRLNRKPQLDLIVNSEKTKDLNTDVSDATSIGDYYFADESKAQSSTYIRINYSPFDYGVSRMEKEIKDSGQQILLYEKQKKQYEIQLEILDIFTTLEWIAAKQDANSQVLSVLNKIDALNKRLLSTGNLSLIEKGKGELEILTLSSEIEINNQEYDAYRLKLSGYAKEELDASSSFVLDPDRSECKAQETLDFSILPDQEILLKQIKQRVLHNEILRRSRRPEIGLYSKYLVYGSDRDSIGKSFSELRKQNYVLGFYLKFDLYDKGIRHDTDKNMIEIEKMQNQIQEELFNDSIARKTLHSRIENYQVRLRCNKEIIKKLEQQISNVEKLEKEKLVARKEVLKEKISLLQQLSESKREYISNKKDLVSIYLRSEFKNLEHKCNLD